jgi:hypothetical protein
MFRKVFSQVFFASLSSVVAIGMACSASASVVVTYGSASEGAYAGGLSVDGASPFTSYGSITLTVSNVSALDYADASNGKATASVVGGGLAGDSGSASLLLNGAWSAGVDAANTNSWFTDNTSGKFLVNLGSKVAISAINTYSREYYANRAQQIYSVYGTNANNGKYDTADGSWALITDVHSALNPEGKGGLQGVSITNGVGTYQYLLFVVSPAEAGNGVGIGYTDYRVGTFYSEIDVVGTAAVPEPSTLALLAGGLLGLIAFAWHKRK